jgi:hypothetical protein
VIGPATRRGRVSISANDVEEFQAAPSKRVARRPLCADTPPRRYHPDHPGTHRRLVEAPDHPDAREAHSERARNRAGVVSCPPAGHLCLWSERSRDTVRADDENLQSMSAKRKPDPPPDTTDLRLSQRVPPSESEETRQATNHLECSRVPSAFVSAHRATDGRCLKVVVELLNQTVRYSDF